MSELVRVEGEVDYVQFKNDDGSFCVIDVRTEDELIKAVGALGNVEEGEMVILTGEYVNNEIYGRQLRVAMFERSLPTTEASILRYLSSGALESVRPLVAKRLVAAFGDKTLEVIENEPERMLEIKGLDKEKIKAINSDFKKTFAARALMVYMSKNRVPTKYSVRAWKRLGDPAEVLIRKNPYLLCGAPPPSSRAR